MVTHALTITQTPRLYMFHSSAAIWCQITHWGRVTHICVSKINIIGSDNGLSPGRRQAIIWTNAGIVNWTPRNKFQWKVNRNSNIFIEENTFENVVCEMLSILSRPQCDKQGTRNFHRWLRNVSFQRLLIKRNGQGGIMKPEKLYHWVQ